MAATTRISLNSVMVASVAGVVVSLGVAGALLLGRGHAAFNTRSDGLMWGLPIVTYDYFLLTSTGLALLACLALAFNVRGLSAIAKRCLWLAAAAAVGAVAALMLELGHPLRSLYAIPLNFQVLSPLFWKAWFIAVYVVLLLVLFSRLHAGRGQATRGVATALAVAALGVTVIAGLVYGMMAMRPYWYGGFVPVYFLAQSLLGGMAFAVLFTYFSHGFDQNALPPAVRTLFASTLPIAFAALLGLVVLFVAVQTITGLWSNAEGLQVWDHQVRSPLFHLGLWGGLVLPLLLMLAPTRRARGGTQALAAALVITGLFIGRYEYIIGGQIVPLFKGSWVPGLIDYLPSAAEWMLLLLSASIFVALYAFGEKRLDLSAAAPERG